MTRRARRQCAVMAAVMVCGLGGVAAAQPTPVFTVDMVQSQSATPVAAPAPKLESADVVQVFAQACIQTRGEAAMATDWALSKGYESLHALRGSSEPLLEGRPGAVLAMPGSDGAVFLVVTDAQCTVWAEGQSGPLVRQSFAALVGQLIAKGAKAQLINERTLERAGAWRNQSQWRFRGVGAPSDLSLGVVTTLTDLPSTQVMRLGPLAAAAPKYAPDGLPER
jgi:hypothetical protein